MLITLLLTAVATVANAASSLMQRKAHLDGSRRLLLLRPIWLAGFGASLVSFVCQAGALSTGSLAVVQTILALELALVVLGSGVFFGAPLGRQEWLSVALMTVGIIGLILVLNPQEETTRLAVPAWQWIAALGLSAAIVGGCCLGAYRVGLRQYSGALLGIGTGVSFGVTAALMKAAMLTLNQSGVVSVFSTWELYAAMIGGLFAFWLLQRALSTGKLVASQPGITLADPFVAIAWGGALYNEPMNGGIAILLALLAAGVLSAGAILLARSPALTKG